MSFEPVEIVVDDTPPSLNALMQSKGLQWEYRKTKHEWQRTFLKLLTEAEMPRGLSKVVVEGICTFPNRIKRDQGNYRFFTEKALGDALTAGGFIPDDDWDHFEFGGLAYEYEKGVRRLRLTLFPTAEREAA